MNLSRAKRGDYGAYSFRGGDTSFRDRYFEPHERRWKLKDFVRGAVRFTQANLLDPDFFEDASFDVIFCRNLLIYFNAAGWDAALETISRLLKKSGMLFM